jgi:hypothetical protein
MMRIDRMHHHHEDTVTLLNSDVNDIKVIDITIKVVDITIKVVYITIKVAVKGAGCK